MNIDIRRILVPTDLTGCARLALRHAVRLAEETDAELHLIHVIEEIEGGDMPGVGNLQSVYSRLNEVLSVEMRVQVREMAGEELEAQQHIRHGAAAAPGILDYADEKDIDLIVMGTHGRQGAERFLIGSTAERVVRFASCNVMTVSPSGAHAADIIRRILIAIDFSDYSDEILRWAGQLAELYNADVYMAHIIEPILRPSFYGGNHVGADFDGGRAADQARSNLLKMYRRITDKKNGNRIFVSRGRAGQEIVRLADANDVNLIVQGAYGLTDSDEMGHVAEDVVRRANCPVFTVKGRS